ncbi:hypothetical protein [Shewanella sp. NIFS-20-20]|uniref:hypothetical protein n=1 Tax=Shewanella sp. NIFS-20-20 TaxID=2853806 RepID=UPI001C456736|nr:hypothetical protein [Shewanella sp. NIFS-20-20]MBV7314365.1 hypothetical protein [Shewanella sp. NIFS-20-20]
MLNLSVVPGVFIMGAIAANLTEFARGETGARLPQFSLGVTTLTLAVLSYTIVWFALLVCGIYSSDGEGFFAGMELLGVFLAGICLYALLPVSRLITAATQRWIYRLALPIILLSTYLVVSIAG